MLRLGVLHLHLACSELPTKASGKPAFKLISKLFKPNVPVGTLGENHHIVLSRKSRMEKHFFRRLLSQIPGHGSTLGKWRDNP